MLMPSFRPAHRLTVLCVRADTRSAGYDPYPEKVETNSLKDPWACWISLAFLMFSFISSSVESISSFNHLDSSTNDRYLKSHAMPKGIPRRGRALFRKRLRIKDGRGRSESSSRRKAFLRRSSVSNVPISLSISRWRSSIVSPRRRRRVCNIPSARRNTVRA
jgi:hypothetical protein